MLRKSTVVVLVLFVALLGLVIFLQSRPQSSANATPGPTPQQLLLGNLSAGDITGIRVVQDGNETLQLGMGNDQVWRVGAQAEAQAEIGKVERLRAELTAIRIISQLNIQAAEGGLSEYGLEPPSTVFVISTQQGDTVTLMIGKQAPTAAGTYAHVVGQPSPVLVSSGSMEAIVEAALALREQENAPPAAP